MTPMFQRFAGLAAILTAAVGVVYTVTFALYVREGYHWAHWASAIALMAGGLVAAPVFVALHARVREAEPEFSMVALVAGLVGVLGASIHGAHDVAKLAKPLHHTGNPNVPSEIDPRGFLTFAITGLALGLFGWLALRTGRFPRVLGQVGVAAMVVLLVVYFGRLIAFDPNRNVIRFAALAAGLVLIPAFHLVVARTLLKRIDT